MNSKEMKLGHYPKFPVDMDSNYLIIFVFKNIYNNKLKAQLNFD